MKYLGRILSPLLLLLIDVYFIMINQLSIREAILPLIANTLVAFGIGWIIDYFIKARKELNKRKIKLEEYLHGLQSITEGISITDEQGLFEFTNEAHNKMYGYEEGELENWHQCYNEETLQYLNSEATPQIHQLGHWHGEATGLKKDGSLFPQELSITKIKDSNKIITVVRDITELKNNEKLVEHMALHNELTDLPNRRILYNTIKDQLQVGGTFYLILVDLDRFKTINETLGYLIGDAILMEIGERLAQLETEGCQLFHLSGDQFILLCWEKDRHNIELLAKKIIDLLTAPVKIDSQGILVSPSIGISFNYGHCMNPDELLMQADTALNYGKQFGRNKIQFYDEKVKTLHERKVIIERELTTAIQNNEFYVVYQPKVELSSNQVTGLEALLRWKSSKLGIISPGEFIPIAEDTKMIEEIGRFIMEEVFKQLQKWLNQYDQQLKVSLNISNLQLRDSQFLFTLQKLIERYQVDPTYIELELTESVTTVPNVIIPLLNEIKAMGIGLSMDDFGTGYSSLSVIQNLPLDTLKVDRSFVKGMTTSLHGKQMLKSILDIGKNLNLTVVVEGVETEAELKMLKEMGCPVVQGYYFSMPLLPEEIEKKYLQ